MLFIELLLQIVLNLVNFASELLEDSVDFIFEMDFVLVQFRLLTFQAWNVLLELFNWAPFFIKVLIDYMA